MTIEPMYENFDIILTICLLPTVERFLIVQELIAFSFEMFFFFFFFFLFTVRLDKHFFYISRWTYCNTYSILQNHKENDQILFLHISHVCLATIHYFIRL